MSLQDIEVRVDKPYPEIVGATDDARVVAILKNLANSRVGELSAVLGYIYQSVETDKVDQEIAAIFEEIGIVEMMHLDMLLHAITDFGGTAKYEDHQASPYTTASLNYSNKLKEMLDGNIKAESFCIENYKKAITAVENESLKQLFARIIEDEVRHIEVFKTIRDTVTFMSI